MHIFMATLATETNTFSPIPTGRAAFRDRQFHRRDGSRQPPGIGNLPLIAWRGLGEADGHRVSESICTFAQPAGITLRHAYEELRGLLLEDLRAAAQEAGPVDAVLLFLHGAMVADGYDDCEGDVIAQVRGIVGSGARIGVELDLHCHLTEAMRTGADILVTFKEYPHTDVLPRAHEVYALTMAAARREIAPVIAVHDCRMVNMWRTPVEPMRGFVARMQALEGRDGILSVSFGHGFPWADVAEVGARTLVIADGDMARAQALAAQLAHEIWTMRDQTVVAHDDIDAAIDHALADRPAGSPADARPLVVADVADNAGGGAPADNTAILRRLVERGVRDVAIGLFWDPVAVQFCLEAGVGETFDLRIGGKCGAASGDPVDLRVTVRGVAEQHAQTGLSGGRAPCGPSAWVHAQGIDIVLVSLRQQAFSPDGFEGLGLMLAGKRMVVVKSTQHFHANFAPIAREVRYVAAPGAIPPSFDTIPYTKRTRPFWPRVADPFALVNEQAGAP